MCTLLQAKRKLSTVIVIASDLKSYPFIMTENDHTLAKCGACFSPEQAKRHGPMIGIRDFSKSGGEVRGQAS